MPNFFKKQKQSSFYNTLGKDSDAVYKAINAYLNHNDILNRSAHAINVLIKGIYETNSVAIPEVEKESKSILDKAMKTQFKKMRNVTNNILLDLIHTPSSKTRVKQIEQWIELADRAFHEGNMPFLQIWMRAYIAGRREFLKQDLKKLSNYHKGKLAELEKTLSMGKTDIEQYCFSVHGSIPLVETLLTSVVYLLDGNHDVNDVIEILEKIYAGYFTSLTVQVTETVEVPQVNNIPVDSFEILTHEQIFSLFNLFNQSETPSFHLTEQSLFKECGKKRAEKDMQPTLEKMNSLLKFHGDKKPLSYVLDRCRAYIEKNKETLEGSPSFIRMTT